MYSHHLSHSFKRQTSSQNWCASNAPHHLRLPSFKKEKTRTFFRERFPLLAITRAWPRCTIMLSAHTGGSHYYRRALLPVLSLGPGTALPLCCFPPSPMLPGVSLVLFFRSFFGFRCPPPPSNTLIVATLAGASGGRCFLELPAVPVVHNCFHRTARPMPCWQ